jgi:putative FmdB family regulatory protein
MLRPACPPRVAAPEDGRTPAVVPSCGSASPLPCGGLTSALVLRRLLWILKAMPLYEYEICEGNCVVCGGKFTLRRPLSAAPLTKCPACKKPVRRVWSTFNSPKSLSISDAKKAGFTVLKRVNKGEYERQ